MTETSHTASRALLVIKPDGTEQRAPYTGKSPKLETLQEHVGGYIELVRVRYDGKIRQAYMNDSGLLDGLPPNDKATRYAREAGYPFDIPLVGTMVIDLPKSHQSDEEQTLQK